MTGNYLVLAAFAVGLVVTLVLAAWLTPSRWWQRPTLRGLAIVAIGTWGLGSLMLLGLQKPVLMADTRATSGIAAIAPLPAGAGRSYRVFEDLNLRAGKGIGARRLAVVPAGTVITTTGVRDGDWWQVSAPVGGKAVLGWSSSLWLRRADEVAR